MIRSLTRAVVVVLSVLLVFTGQPTAASLSVPLCTDHDSTKWHGLVKFNLDGSVNCTYGHEHGMDPAQLDGTFGALPLTQQISYPWATANENSTTAPFPNKHRAYAWLGSNSLTCSTPGALRVTAFETEAHDDGSMGFLSRYHSYWSRWRVQACGDPNSVGYVSFGGWIDMAILTVDHPPVRLPLSTDPPAGCVIGGDSRHESSTLYPATDDVWYGNTSRAVPCDDAYSSTSPGVASQKNWGLDAFGMVNKAACSGSTCNEVLYADAPAGHHSQTVHRTDSEVVTLRNWGTTPGQYKNAAGYVTFDGKVDHGGTLVPSGCTLSPDCIPIHIQHVKAGTYTSETSGAQAIVYNGDVPGPQGQPGYYVALPQ